MNPQRSTILFAADEFARRHAFATKARGFELARELGRAGLLILVLAGIVLGLAACEPKPPKPKVFSTHERSIL